MRKIILVIVIGIMMVVGFGLFIAYKIASNTDIAINVNDTEDHYQVEASFGRNQTRKVLSYIDGQLSKTKQFRHSHLDEDIELEDHTKLYINAKPGKVFIKVNKDENDSTSIERIKTLTEGIKIRLTEN